jgi:hypothetical protein
MIVGFCRALCRVLLSGNLSTRQTCGLWNQQRKRDLSEMSGSKKRREPQRNWTAANCRNCGGDNPQLIHLIGLA